MRITIIPFTLILSLLLKTTHAQRQDDTFKFFDAAWKQVKEKKAVYLLRIHSTEDNCRQYSYYNMYGPLIKIETYQDEKTTMRQGLFAWYNSEGKMDSSGYYYRGLPDKDWVYPDAAGKVRQEKHYDKGKLLSDKEFEEKLKAEEIIDPAYPDLSRLSPESYFPGGNAGWIQYLTKNFRYPDRAVDNLVGGTVLALFIIEPTGKIQDLQIFRSIELSLDDETIRILENSPTWIPAIRFERKVRSYKIQPMVFKMEVSNAQ